MVRSMTGYGSAETVAGSRKITVEIRTLNCKQLDLAVKSPAYYRPREQDIRGIASKAIRRGKADIYISYENTGCRSDSVINGELFASYYSQLREITSGVGLEWGGDMNAGAAVQAILRMPDVVCGYNETLGEEEAAALMAAVDSALARLEKFRTAEGEVLAADILKRVGVIEEYRDEIEPYEKPRIEAVKSRIRENLESVGLQVDANRLEQEIVFYVEKLDITEEKVRLANHCRYFREVACGEDDPGRKLGFIAQEMGREINTIGSKANDVNIQKIVVGMKDELEKIKEQLLNIL